ERDQTVQQVTARDQLDRVGAPGAADQRGLPALGAHRDAVGDRDRVEFDRRAAAGADALGDLLGELAVVGVAWRQLDPAVRDADERAREVLVGEAHGTEVRARGGAIGAVQQRAALVAGIERHGSPPMRSQSSTLTACASVVDTLLTLLLRAGARGLRASHAPA